MLLFNAVVLSVLVMLILSVARVHVVISLFVASLVGGLVAGMGVSGTMVAFQDGLAGGAKIALSYALLGAFAMSVAHSGLPRLLANWIIKKLRNADDSNSARVARSAKWGILGGQQSCDCGAAGARHPINELRGDRARLALSEE